MEFKKLSVLTIFTDEDVVCDGRPMHKVIILKAKELGLAGATIIKGYSGFATTTRRMDDLTKFFSGVYKKPMVVNIVDSREKIEPFLVFLEKHAEHCLVTLSETEVLLTDYLKDKMKNYEK